MVSARVRAQALALASATLVPWAAPEYSAAVVTRNVDIASIGKALAELPLVGTASTLRFAV
jgi:hypothetical protein